MLSHSPEDAPNVTFTQESPSHGLTQFSKALKAIAKPFKIIGQTSDVSYHLLGRYTFPIGDQKPIHFCDLNPFGAILLTVPIPLIPLSIFASITIVPFFGNSFQSLLRSYIWSTNFSLFDLEERKLHLPACLGDEKDKRNWLRKIYGSLGGLTGIFFGLLSSAIIILARILSNTLKTMFHTLVAAAHWTWHLNKTNEGTKIKGERVNRALFSRILGAPLGYPLGALFSVPVMFGILLCRTLIFVVRKIPSVLRVVLGVIVSPVVFSCKGIAKIISVSRNSERFKKKDDQDPILQKFMNLYSALNAFGRFKEGSEIKVDQNGKKTRWSVVRKGFLFNEKTMTEKLLDCLLATYRSSKFDSTRSEENLEKNEDNLKGDEENQLSKENFQINEADLWKAATEYKSKCIGFFTLRSTEVKIEGEINRTVQFINDYLQGKVQVVPMLYHSGGDQSTHLTGKNTIWHEAEKSKEQEKGNAKEEMSRNNSSERIDSLTRDLDKELGISP